MFSIYVDSLALGVLPKAKPLREAILIAVEYRPNVSFLCFILVSVCNEFSVQRLVYTSTFNVVFGGQTIENGDESLPYLPIEKVKYKLHINNVMYECVWITSY